MSILHFSLFRFWRSKRHLGCWKLIESDFCNLPFISKSSDLIIIRAKIINKQGVQFFHNKNGWSAPTGVAHNDRHHYTFISIATGVDAFNAANWRGPPHSAEFAFPGLTLGHDGTNTARLTADLYDRFNDRAADNVHIYIVLSSLIYFLSECKGS